MKKVKRKRAKSVVPIEEKTIVKNYKIICPHCMTVLKGGALGGAFGGIFAKKIDRLLWDFP